MLTQKISLASANGLNVTISETVWLAYTREFNGSCVGHSEEDVPFHLENDACESLLVPSS